LTKYYADNYELRIATTEGGLATASPLSNWQSVDVKTGHSRKRYPVGIGSRMQVVHAGLLVYSGSVKGHYDDAAIAGSANVLALFQMFQQASLTPLFIKVSNKVTNSYIILKNVTGDPAVSLASPEAVVAWTWDFDFEDISYG
jgi:hypothetical protein